MFIFAPPSSDNKQKKIAEIKLLTSATPSLVQPSKHWPKMVTEFRQNLHFLTMRKTMPKADAWPLASSQILL